MAVGKEGEKRIIIRRLDQEGFPPERKDKELCLQLTHDVLRLNQEALNELGVLACAYDLAGGGKPSLPWPYRLEGSCPEDGNPPFFLREADGFRAVYQWPNNVDRAYAPNVLLYFLPEVNFDGAERVVEAGYWWSRRENGFWFAHGAGAVVCAGGNLTPAVDMVSEYIFRRAQFGKGAAVDCWRSWPSGSGRWQFLINTGEERPDMISGQVDPRKNLIRIKGVEGDEACDMIELLSSLLPDCLGESEWGIVIAGGEQPFARVVFAS